MSLPRKQIPIIIQIITGKPDFQTEKNGYLLPIPKDMAEVWSEFDIACMNRAIGLAERGRGQVSPNPPVGCVLVLNGRIIAEGWHNHLGDLHAEQAAIADAESRGVTTEGAMAYVTLEPCNHFGLTPPCTQALLWAGVKDVIVATRDPNPMVRGEGIKVLLDAGISVREGLLGTKARLQMQSFMNWCEHRRPLVTLKAAMDVNGVIDGNFSGRFTSEISLDAAHRLRRHCDAIVVGVNTVVKDNPQLNIRRVPLGQSQQPLRIVLDRSLRTPKSAILLTDGGETIIVHSLSDSQGVTLPSGNNGVNLNALLDHLGDRGIQDILVEGGASVWKQFLEEKLVDRAIIIQSSVELGEGPKANLDATLMENAGLNMIGTSNWGGDNVKFWSRSNLEWPSNEWP
ncbi:MAG: bifunctional diaminohydroxyphosphoribosylaminopyrimidine deaminase/5-amino-6-(5-phosphoribosylamino)uracil reductase RibD [Candidatus Thalassarchaeaceae archaeon]|jgi:diaminohydroxyphosphoribosylaminopyrimidine deaminase/5-amino-6-(5-phosphoribosylamino)uracil reductase|nr:bifunctional diaminohydroxyphosphoribosylaminopyrimidine deaminase/5-amino-6-(5-phosphoribosylamino)uracil reductase RibD [Candidatus Thalassarchaeaceae archaeon]